MRLRLPSGLKSLELSSSPRPPRPTDLLEPLCSLPNSCFVPSRFVSSRFALPVLHLPVSFGVPQVSMTQCVGAIARCVNFTVVCITLVARPQISVKYSCMNISRVPITASRCGCGVESDADWFRDSGGLPSRKHNLSAVRGNLTETRRYN